MNRKLTKLTVIGCAACMFLNTSYISYAAGVPSEKEEVVYAKLESGGNVEGIYVVNQLNGGDILDYGKYDSIRNMSSNDELIYDGSSVSGTTVDDQIYYEGVLSDTNLPWTVSIRYFLDGKEYTPDKIAGETGHLKIEFSVKQNENCILDFYDYYALQASFTLDGAVFKNIEADDASIANAGSAKKLTYTILPGRGIDTVICADVVSFEMKEVNINGLKLNMNIDIDDEMLKEKIDELMDATEKMNNGALTLSDGAYRLRDGSGTLKNGTSDLNDGIVSLDEGILSLQSGILTMQSGINTLNSRSYMLTDGSADILNALNRIQSGLQGISGSTQDLSKLVSASGEIKQGIGSLYTAAQSLKSSISYERYKSILSDNGLNIDDLSARNTAAINAMTEQISDMNSAIERIKASEDYASNEDLVVLIEESQAQLAVLQNSIQLLGAGNALIGSTENYLNTVEGSMDALISGLSSLNEKYEVFDASISALADSLANMTVNMSVLSSGINELTEQYTKLDDGINEYTEGVAAIAAGYNQLAEGVSQLASGSSLLVEGSDSLMNGTYELYDKVNDLYDGSVELSDGTSLFYDKTSSMDTDIEDKIDSILDSMGGDEIKSQSFVSDKNTNVKSVQFVIKTEPIEIPKEPEVVEDTQEITFSQKLKDLFR